MSDRDRSGMTRNQQQSLEDLLPIFLAWANERRRIDTSNHYDDPSRYHAQHQPGVSHAMSDAISSMHHLIPQSVPSAPTPPKRSEAEEAFNINQRAYVFIDHLDNKEWEPLLGMMTRSIKVPKTECSLVPSLGNKVNFDYPEETSSDYVEHLKSPEGLGSKGGRLVTYHQLGASFIAPVSSSEKHAHCQTKIVQMRYAHTQYGRNARIEARANAVMEMTLIFKKEDGEWKISGMAGFIRWIEFSKPKLFIGTNHPEEDPGRKKIVENTLRYHRLLPVPRKETGSWSQQQNQKYTSRGNGASFDHRYRSQDDDHLGLGYQGGHPATRRLLR